MSTTHSAPSTGSYNYLRLLWLILLIPAWMLQYLIVVPTVWLWGHMVVPAAKIGGIVFVLLFIPIIGWVIILLILILRRKPTVIIQSADGSVSQPVKPKSTYARPWGQTLIAGD